MEKVSIKREEYEIQQKNPNRLAKLNIDPIFDSIKDRILANDPDTRAAIALEILKRTERNEKI